MTIEYKCVACQKLHNNEWSETCHECDRERESGDLNLDDEESES